ncbi:MAG: polysaccharide biosynthesis/export family protein [Bacteroidia bacterium]|nr:polysaccharide biosynthesis/export family protein [Bacteroidia bacterium]NNF30496.1 sugar transporter [Flavobacteriaceae bacterium]MBT8276526.1 polysaccharide biosynthesis/export family protein [Bacteroidia bacterium]NNJ82187.1 sugar transporter [Flavobacteriaceae bacterium]NNK53856.1 sugar transporter [Flavobacteriaceae bacterium]
MRKVILFSLVIVSFLSCATKKEIIYFQDSSELNDTEIPEIFEPLIEPNDILHISISSFDETLVMPFNKERIAENNANVDNLALQGYLVDSGGSINFPVLGSISVGGKSRSEIEQMLKKMLLEYVTDVVVDVRILNFKVTILGEVRNPGVYTIRNERVTIPEALGLAGDLSEDGDRNNISIIREENGKRIVTKVDITQTDLFSSPFFFLKQNDIIYVEPSLRGVKKSGFIPDIPALLSLVTVMLSAVIIITR